MVFALDRFPSIVASCQNSPVGKRLPQALYVHWSALKALPQELQDYERQARAQEDAAGATLVKFSTQRPKISYLFYPDFETDPHPALQASIIADLEAGSTSRRDYSQRDNPPILHRKETFLLPDHPLYELFRHLTRWEEALGLLDNSRSIGTRQEWEQLLESRGLIFVGHGLACPLPTLQVERHKAALLRKSLSRPLRLALEAELLVPGETTFFDYGCGYGSDIQHLNSLGCTGGGWDPYYHPQESRMPADVVNLGYVINVIEDLQERRQALLEAWSLSRQVLIVAAQVLLDDRDRGTVAYGDGVITSRNTFQKYYEQEELKAYIDQVLQVDAIPAGLGIYLVFRDEALAQAFRLSRFHSSAKTPRIRREVRRFEDYESLLVPLIEFFTERGRLPLAGELTNEEELKAEFGSFRRAFKVILQVTDLEDWDRITLKRRQDLLVYLALSHFDRRLKLKDFAPQVRADIKVLFGGYQQACNLADMMLLSLRDLRNIARLCRESPVGKKLHNALLIHISALDSLAPLLRLYEGCASRTFGRLEEVNVIKLFCDRPKIVYLSFPDFDTNPQPKLQASMEVALGDVNVIYRDFSPDRGGPTLQDKEMLGAVTVEDNESQLAGTNSH